MATDHRTIPVGKDQFAIVDAADFEWLSHWKWLLHRKGYAYRRPTVTGGGHKTIFMHREILKPSEGLETDHWNRNKLDNRRDNLRAVTRSRNHLNRPVTANSKSGVNGVIWCKQKSKWRVSITVDKKPRSLGYFTDLGDAIRVRKEAEASLLC